MFGKVFQPIDKAKESLALGICLQDRYRFSANEKDALGEVGLNLCDFRGHLGMSLFKYDARVLILSL